MSRTRVYNSRVLFLGWVSRLSFAQIRCIIQSFATKKKKEKKGEQKRNEHSERALSGLRFCSHFHITRHFALPVARFNFPPVVRLMKRMARRATRTKRSLIFSVRDERLIIPCPHVSTFVPLLFPLSLSLSHTHFSEIIEYVLFLLAVIMNSRNAQLSVNIRYYSLVRLVR